MNERNERMGQLGSGSGIAMGFICGALLGAGVALLVAPATGAETRRKIGDTARRLRKELPEKARGLANQTRSTFGALQEGVNKGISEGRSTFDREREARSVYSEREGA